MHFTNFLFVESTAGKKRGQKVFLVLTPLNKLKKPKTCFLVSNTLVISKSRVSQPKSMANLIFTTIQKQFGQVVDLIFHLSK